MKNSEKEFSKKLQKKSEKKIRKIISEILKKQIIKIFRNGDPKIMLCMQAYYI
jgi:hypothetical protein